MTDALTQMSQEVGDRMIDGASLSEIEDYIDGLVASDDVLAALWLLAFSYLPPARQRREATLTLQAIAA